MDEVFTFGRYLKVIYTQPIQAFIVFSILYVFLEGKKALKPSEGSQNEAAHNMLLLLFNSVIIITLFANLGLVSNFVYEGLNMPHVSTEFWGKLPMPVTFLVTLAMLDFANYWGHRLLHTKYFWGVHVLHHADAHMTWTTLWRIHALEFLVVKIAFVFTVGWLFLPVEVIAIAAVVRHWHLMLIHCQLGWTFGPFRKIIASPNYHRWHHSIAPEAYDKNLCDMFPIWDILFGTHYDPGLCETDIGVEDAEEGFIAGQLYPFKYTYRAIKKRLPAKRPTPSQIP